MPEMKVGAQTIEHGRAYFGPGARLSVSDTDVEGLVAQGCTIVEPEAANKEPEMDLTGAAGSMSLEEAFVEMVARAAQGEGEDLFTQDGRPEVRALKQLTGRGVTAELRDTAWAAFVAATETLDEREDEATPDNEAETISEPASEA
ncbi:MAG: hypothetical protein P1U84_12160 [Parvibaculaceae bacterium]|nr:hypothetical protein [Parvibaculaceae bacterium]